MRCLQRRPFGTSGVRILLKHPTPSTPATPPTPLLPRFFGINSGARRRQTTLARPPPGQGQALISAARAVSEVPLGQGRVPDDSDNSGKPDGLGSVWFEMGRELPQPTYSGNHSTAAKALAIPHVLLQRMCPGSSQLRP